MLHPSLLTFALAGLFPAGAGRAAGRAARRPGPYLPLDEFLVERSDGLTRKVQRPPRHLDRPVVTGEEDRNDQPYVTVLRDPKSGRFRLWYDASGSSTGKTPGRS